MVQVVSYIYFTRIIVFLLGSTLPWRQAWATTVATQVRHPAPSPKLCRGTLPFVRSHTHCTVDNSWRRSFSTR